MSKTYTPVMFFSAAIKIIPHSCTKVEFLGRPTSIEEFANCGEVTLDIESGTGEYLVRNPKTLAFMEGPEA